MKISKTVPTIASAALSTLLVMTMSTTHANETPADGWTGNVSAYLGRKFVDDNDWPDIDSQRSAGVISDFARRSWPVSIAADLITAGADHRSGANEVTGGSIEMHLGARKVFTLEKSRFSPYLGGGLAVITAILENENAIFTVDDDDTVVGAWVGVGTYFAVTPHINLGLDIRYSKAEVTLFDKDLEAGGLNAGITAGYHW